MVPVTAVLWRGPDNTWWHFATMALSVNVNWERRIGMFRTFFDEDGLMHSDTYFGDYPHWVPEAGDTAGKFAGWMLLSYKKPVTASSSEGEHIASNISDENVKSFWLASENNDQQWLMIDLEKAMDIYSLQVNYHDYKSELYGRVPDLYHQYLIEFSQDGKSWEVLVDKLDGQADVPNDYVELEAPVKGRFVRFKNKHTPTPNLALSALRIFGKGEGKPAKAVKDFQVQRQTDRRDALLTWKEVSGAQGYNVLWGIAPDKLYSSWLLYEETSLDLKSLGRDQEYYFAIEAFNENGVSKRSKAIRVE